MIDNKIALALEEFIEYINKELYFQAHEILEDIWHIAKRVNHPQTLLIKGLINASISFEHIKRNRVNSLNSSRVTIQSYYRYKDMNIPSINNYKLFDKACKIIDTHKYMNIIN